MLTKTIDKLPPQIKKEAMDYIEFLVRKHRGSKRKGSWKFEWAGCLSHLKNQYTSVELQHKASEWR